MLRTNANLMGPTPNKVASRPKQEEKNLLSPFLHRRRKSSISWTAWKVFDRVPQRECDPNSASSRPNGWCGGRGTSTDQRPHRHHAPRRSIALHPGRLGNIDSSDCPGMRFQTFILENYHCPVVWPLIPAMLHSTIWISHTNGDAPASTSMVASGLNYHFCSPSEFFSVTADLPFTFASSVAADVIKNHLIRIGVFAIHGIIFRIHGDRQAAVNDVISTTAIKRSGQISNFESSVGPQAHQRQHPSAQPGNLPDPSTASQLDGSTKQPSACPLYGDHCNPGMNSAVKSTFCAPPS